MTPPLSDLLLAANGVPLGFNILVALAALGIPLLALGLEVAADTATKVFYRKFSQQMTRLGVFALTYILAVIAVAVTIVALRRPGTATSWDPAWPIILPPAVSLIALLAGFFAYATTWRQMKGNSGLHKAIGMVGGLGGIATLTTLLAVFGRTLSAAPGSPPVPPATVYLPPVGSPVWPIIAQALPLSVACAAILGIVYLILRRNRDDFGRDYYNFSMRSGARIALTLFAAHLAAFAWPALEMWPTFSAWPPVSSTRIAFYIAAAFAALVLLCLALLARSEHPMRAKALAVAAFVCLWGWIAGNCFVALKMLLA